MVAQSSDICELSNFSIIFFFNANYTSASTFSNLIDEMLHWNVTFPYFSRLKRILNHMNIVILTSLISPSLVLFSLCIWILWILYACFLFFVLILCFYPDIPLTCTPWFCIFYEPQQSYRINNIWSCFCVNKSFWAGNWSEYFFPLILKLVNGDWINEVLWKPWLWNRMALN